MAIVSLATMKNWFKTGMKPTQTQFWNVFDSFWHKEDVIKISDVEGLEQTLDDKAAANHTHNMYAKVDASNLDEENILSWQEALSVHSVSSDADIKLSQSFEFLELTDENNQADFNSAAANKLESQETTLNNKLSRPEEPGTVEDFPFVVLIDEDGASSKTPAGDLGKNIGNTDLVLTGPRILDTDGKPFSIKALPNKQADATFNELLGKNSLDQLARVGYPAFKAQVEAWTQNQRNEFAQILNGGFSTGSMSVNLISPTVFELENNDLYITLRGANLALHPTNRKIEILDASDNSVLAEVPNNQISIATANNLVFYYNFYSLGTGTYRLKITNGAATYITTRTFQVTGTVNNIDLSGNTFDLLTSYTNTLSYSTNNTVFFQNEINGTANPTPIFSAKSDELFEQGDDWYLELQVECSMSAEGAEIDTRIGIGYSNTANQLLFSSLNYFYLRSRSNANSITWGVKTAAQAVTASPFSTSVIFIKQGNLLTVVSGGMIYSETISNNSGYSIFFQAPNRVPLETTSIQIVKAYTF